MEIQILLSLIVSIITIILQALSGNPTPPFGPDSDIDWPTGVTVSCKPSTWTNNQSNKFYVAGTIGKECTLKFDSRNSAAFSLIERTTTLVGEHLESTADEIKDNDDRSVISKEYYKTFVSGKGKDEARVSGPVQFTSNQVNKLRTYFEPNKISPQGNGAYIKTVRNIVELEKLDSSTYRARFMTYSNVIRPWFASEQTFGPMLVKMQKDQIEKQVPHVIKHWLKDM